jgi:hypothetical protein
MVNYMVNNLFLPNSRDQILEAVAEHNPVHWVGYSRSGDYFTASLGHLGEQPLWIMG